MLTSGELLHVRRPYQIISEVNYVLKLWTIRSAGSKEIYNQRYGRFNIDKIWRDDILPCRLYLRHWWVFPVERYRHIVLNALWSCFFHLLHKFVISVTQIMHATKNLGYILSVLPCSTSVRLTSQSKLHLWRKNGIIAFWHLKASYISEAKGNHCFQHCSYPREHIFLHNNHSLLYEVWHRSMVLLIF